MSDHITYSFYSQLDFLLSAQNLMILIFVVEIYWKVYYIGFSKYRLKNSLKKFVLNHHDMLDIKYSMEEINEFIRSHFS